MRANRSRTRTSLDTVGRARRRPDRRPVPGGHAARGAALVGLLALLACGGDGAGAPGPSDAGPAADTPGGAPAEPTPARTIDPATVGRASGVVRVQGDVPAPAPLTIVGETYCVGIHKQTPIMDERLVATGGGLRDAFVWVAQGLEDYAFEPPAAEVVLDQVGCRYVPHVLGVQVGQTLLAKNSDGVMHNVHTKPDENKPKNFGMPPGAAPRPLDFRRGEIMVEVVCDVHAWMKSWIGVVPHPFFAVTGDDGRFTIEGLPPGQYVLGVWHERLGTQELPFTLEPGGAATLDVSFTL